MRAVVTRNISNNVSDFPKPEMRQYTRVVIHLEEPLQIYNPQEVLDFLNAKTHLKISSQPLHMNDKNEPH
jgi:hypothetical protein